VKVAEPIRVGVNAIEKGDCVLYIRGTSVGSDTLWNTRTCVIVFVAEVAATFVAEFIVRVEPVAGAKVRFEAGTCVYPVRSSTGVASLVDVACAWALGPAKGRIAMPLMLFAGATPDPPSSQYAA